MSAPEPQPNHGETMRLRISCPDKPGLIATTTSFLAERGLNIIDVDQHSGSDGTFYMRLVFASPGEAKEAALTDEFARSVAGPDEMEFRFTPGRDRRRLAILCSREGHCLLDLLWRWRGGELDADIVAIVSNHPDHADDVASYGLPYHHVPITRGGKPEGERRILELLQDRVDLIVLARYMQILSADFLDRIGVPLINIHHSFLPAFIGATPYEQAYERGVKVIGATAHYVSEELDAGPIIAQGVEPITHRDEPEDLAKLGRDIERIVLARAVQAHLEDRVINTGQRTIVF